MEKNKQIQLHKNKKSYHKGKVFLLCLIILLLLIFIQRFFLKIDLSLVRQFQKPTFCIEVNDYSDDGVGKFLGLGYSFDVETFFPEQCVPKGTPTPDFTQYAINILGLEIDSRSIDFDWETFEGTIYKVEKVENEDFYYVYLSDVGKKKIMISSMTEYGSVNASGDCEMKEGDEISVDVAYFEFLMTGSRSHWIYPASMVRFISDVR